MSKTLYCSFCGRSQHEVEMLINGPGLIFICETCVECCAQVVVERRAAQEKADALVAESDVVADNTLKRD